jgi:hypothetical protein
MSDHRVYRPNSTSPKTGQGRAQRWFPIPPSQVCAECEVAPATERHHWDRNPLNNAPTNVIFVCTPCHHRRFHPGAFETVVAQRRAITHCPQGHPYDEGNTHVDRRGYRTCRLCRLEYKRAYRARLKERKRK